MMVGRIYVRTIPFTAHTWHIAPTIDTSIHMICLSASVFIGESCMCQDNFGARSGGLRGREGSWGPALCARRTARNRTIIVFINTTRYIKEKRRRPDHDKGYNYQSRKGKRNRERWSSPSISSSYGTSHYTRYSRSRARAARSVLLLEKKDRPDFDSLENLLHLTLF